MKTAKSILMLLLATIIPGLASAHNFEEGAFTYTINPDGKTVTLAGKYQTMIPLDAPIRAPYDGLVGDVVLPSSVKHGGKTYSVTAIGQYAFSGNTKLVSMTIPKSVKAIGNYAFIQCFSLKAVTLPAGLTEINDYLFAECNSLSEIIIPDKVERIGNWAFSGRRW